MAFSRRLGVIGIVGASWLVAVACNDDDDQLTPTAGAGEAGEAPGGGKSSVAGSQNNGGKASAGSAGKGGTTSAGTGGVVGGGGDAGNGATTSMAGQAGSGGEAAGAGGAGGDATGGVGGATGGSGGEGGASEPVVPAAHCSYTCASDDDCLIDGDDTIKCNLTTFKCEDPSEACTADATCLVSLSFLFKPCATDANCTANTEACVEADGQGFCAKVPGAGVPACAGSNVPKTLPKFGAQGTVSVCAHPDARCFAGKCRAGCGTPGAGCGIGNGDTCSATTGLCGCTNGTECTTTGICGSNGLCQECEIDDDCAENVTDTACLGGKCGCASATVCTDNNPGYATATPLCQ
jgi:hypothetical protein